MNQAAFSDFITRRFRAPEAKTIFACNDWKEPIAISHVVAPPMRTEPSAPDAAFTIHTHLGSVSHAEMYADGRPLGLKPQPPGSVRVLNMATSPYADMRDPADFLRFNVAQSTLDDFAYERGQRSPGSLRQVINAEDAVLHGLGRALMARLPLYAPDDRLFFDYVALAFLAHIIAAYGKTRPVEARGRLAPWQLRRACEMMVANLAGNVTVRELARACGLSTSHFAQAFRHTVELPPHRWLMRERVKRARHLLLHSSLTLPDIAVSCGFTDQSHFTRVFVRLVGMPPARWRKLART